MQDVDTQKHVYTVSELTKYIRVILEDTFSRVLVEGEISNYIRHSSGHIYFSLKDEGSVINCAFFKYANKNLKFKPEDGLKVLCRGRISVYDKRGQYQLYIEKIEPKGLGALQLAFEQLKEKLNKEGLFDEAHKMPIPYLPSKIGVVTSPTGAAIRDMLRVTRQRFQNIDIIINPVRVQGEGSELEIACAIEDFNRFGDVDVIIVGRGGGSLEDLWAFNEEVVARAIYNSRIPIISAVGHEVDWTIADFVADLRSPTPSAAAEAVIPKKADLIETIREHTKRLKSALTGHIEDLETRLKNLSESYIFRQPLNIIQQHQQRIDDIVKAIKTKTDHVVEIKAGLFKNLLGRLNSLSPFAVLERGYSLTTKLPGGDLVKDAKHLKRGDRVKTRLMNGLFVSSVERIEEKDRDGRDKI
ncbi:MAG: exodeoxyribonuclease VII large subunit [Candidatus Omnitrophica bacterium]|nr:exodeoxyribonuclease VII large subunit [Candidatus Omnitrophota bacterium]